MPGNKPVLAHRMAGIAPFHVMDILAKAREMDARGLDVVHMEVGEPDFSSPRPVIEAGIRSLQQGLTHYTPALGLPALRQAIADYYLSRFGVQVDASRIVVTPGASGALQLILGVLINPGEKVLMADPGYPCNRHMVRMFGGEAVSLGVKASQDFALANDQVIRHWDRSTRALMVATPANPTGRLLSLQQLRFLYDAVRAPDGMLIVDEIYQGLVYDRPVETALKLGQDNLFVVNSFSKFFGMTGWRLGWIVAPEEYVPALDRLAQNIFLAAPTVAQHAALAAFQPATLSVLEERREVFQERRDYLYDALVNLGFRIQGKPEGAFYLYADVSAFSGDSFDFARQLLDRAAVAITPGRDFGSYRAEKFVRFAYTTDLSRLKLGVERIAAFLG
ncbi:pyridoxal phosphate-dependent aminotransferase [Thiolapillus sp.]|uniref:pyridoxal phosphate-dependent aminotransferase n=6 Tax=Thiolapillus sp. TaxID=2017437 RepID=UPI0025CC04AA|nr:pyridoxal phosphate-dependent aminotransferase [Thiolapillus sp.]